MSDEHDKRPEGKNGADRNAESVEGSSDREPSKSVPPSSQGNGHGPEYRQGLDQHPAPGYESYPGAWNGVPGAPPPHEPERNHSAEVFKGLAILFLLHFLHAAFPAAIFVIGISQLIYLIPAAIIAFNRKRIGIGQGILIGGAITFLLNAACFGIIMGKF
ncbi:hypothetical protein [Paenibacillus sp. J22TS3]|uniref:hypothetical protein n=1 Tax=Paenibacillus sp. J22TS3 TaxID=2807192 RepID=UPI001B18DD5C|nr:hypothetical protein [Paenibacillus sp. J22TS3]GIP23890.1 hypothetical protein J22TS3_41650 [Paenibacillus sp. J22TS3]